MKRNGREVTRLVNYVNQEATPEQLMEDYGIELYEDGAVYDAVEDHIFDTVVDWAENMIRSNTPEPTDYRRYPVTEEE